MGLIRFRQSTRVDTFQPKASIRLQDIVDP
jgi:hypothetical protein